METIIKITIVLVAIAAVKLSVDLYKAIKSK